MIGRKVYGEGRLPNRVLICGEGPGRTEAEEGRPFVGASGIELEYLYLRRAARINRQDVYITNVLKWRTDEDDSDPTEEDIARDEPELLAEIEVCNPKIIVAVGRIAAGWFLQTQEVDMEKYVGAPVRCPRYPDRILLCTYHPAAGLRQPERYYHQIYWAFQQLGRLLRGEIGVIEDKTPIHYSDMGPFSLPLGNRPLVVAVDTEGTVARPWGLSFAGEEGRAGVLRGGGDSPAKGQLRDVLASSTVVAHNLLYDMDVISALSVPVIPDRCEDTMLMSYLLPHLPRRLKALSFKLTGVEQEEYEDVTKEADEGIARMYLQAVLGKCCRSCEGAGTTKVPYKADIKKYGDFEAWVRVTRGEARFKTERCDACRGDGTGWPQPGAGVEPDKDSGRGSRAHSVGRRVRSILKRGTGLREGWAQVDDSLRAPVEAELGRMKETTLDDVDLSRAIHYSAADADLTLRVYNRLKPELERQGLWRVYEIDKGIIPIIHRMHANGIRIDRSHFSALDGLFSKEQSSILDRLGNLSGVGDLNPSSPLQVAEILYDKFKLQPLRGKRSTDEKTLETLKIRHKSRSEVCEFIDQITEYRELDKLLGTYVRPLPLAADETGRIHTRFLLHVTHTGRLSSRDPNLQNIPTRTDRGRLIRRGFIPRDGCRLISVDLSQIELRVAAHLSEDENLINAFLSDIDVHTSTAAIMYGKPIAEVTAEERRTAKTINFLVLYGGGPNKLYQELVLLGINYTKDQCVGLINDWFKAYPGVRDYITRCHTQAKSVGYVEDLFGGRRYVPGVWSCIDKIKEESLKWATNTPVQGTAARLLKIWLRRIWDHTLPAYWGRGYYVEPLLTIHDEVILEAEEAIADQVIEDIVQQALLTAQLAVPIKANGISAYSWDKLKE